MFRSEARVFEQCGNALSDQEECTFEQSFLSQGLAENLPILSLGLSFRRSETIVGLRESSSMVLRDPEMITRHSPKTIPRGHFQELFGEHVAFMAYLYMSVHADLIQLEGNPGLSGQYGGCSPLGQDCQSVLGTRSVMYKVDQSHCHSGRVAVLEHVAPYGNPGSAC